MDKISSSASSTLRSPAITDDFDSEPETMQGALQSVSKGTQLLALAWRKRKASSSSRSTDVRHLPCNKELLVDV